MEIHSATMTKRMCVYIDILAVSPATLLLLYEASFDTAPCPSYRPCLSYDVPSPLALLLLLLVDEETLCCFIIDRGHTHFI